MATLIIIISIAGIVSDKFNPFEVMNACAILAISAGIYGLISLGVDFDGFTDVFFDSKQALN
jgi:hypothetical protein